MNILDVRPEVAAGGYSRDDSTVEFFVRIGALVRPTDVVLDLGAGRGGHLEGGGFSKSLRRLKGRVAFLHGCDIDPVVMTNQWLDEARIAKLGEPLPYKSDMFDLVFSDWVLEHVDDPSSFASEAHRVLKPGGWLCARTPAKWGYIGIAARAIPEALEDRVLSFVQPNRETRDVFPKRYRVNTLRDVRKHFPSGLWNVCAYYGNSIPAYYGRSRLIFSLIEMFQKFAPRGMSSVLYVFVQKR